MTIDLKQVIRRLNPNVPAGLNDSVLPRIPRDSNTIRQLYTHLNADPLAKVLLTGHIGVGKSTELLYLAQKMNKERLVIQASVSKTLGTHNLDTFSLLLIILEASLQAWIEHFKELPVGLVEELVNHIQKLMPAEDTGDVFASLLNPELPASVPKTSTGSQLLNLYSKALRRLALREVLPSQIATLALSAMVESCEIILNELENQARKPVLLILDDLDKVRNDSAQRDIFGERAMAWLRLPCGVVATLPLKLLFSSQGRELDEIWGEVHILEPLVVPSLEGESWTDPDLQFYLQLLAAVNAQEVFSALQCRKLAHLANGLPRSFVNVCAAAVRYVIEADGDHVRDYHIDFVKRDLLARWRGRLNNEDYQALIAVLDSDGSNVPNALDLLGDGLLIRDGNAHDSQQFRLASWATPLVEAYRHRQMKKTTLTTGD
jgi:hypothetical protein